MLADPRIFATLSSRLVAVFSRRLGYAASQPGRSHWAVLLGPCWVPRGLQCRPRAANPCPGEGRRGAQDQGSVCFSQHPMSLAPHCVTRLADYQPVSLSPRSHGPDRAPVSRTQALGGGGPGLCPSHPGPVTRRRWNSRVDSNCLENWPSMANTLRRRLPRAQDEPAGDPMAPPHRALPAHQLGCASRPKTNTTLEGLLRQRRTVLRPSAKPRGSGGISFHPDRPDLLSRFRVRPGRPTAATARWLLSNGNGGGSRGSLAGEFGTMPIWDDPFPKPSYCLPWGPAGGRRCGRPHQQPRGQRATPPPRGARDAPSPPTPVAHLHGRWPGMERVYGWSRTSNEFNIGGPCAFQPWARWRTRRLNIFNSKLVLADAVTATDGELERIENCDCPQYFHN